jgi:hypothetical protein
MDGVEKMTTFITGINQPLYEQFGFKNDGQTFAKFGDATFEKAS